MNEKNFDSLIRNVQAMIRCPHCGSSYSTDNITIVGNVGEAVLVQLSCISCKMPVMATIVAKDMNKISDSTSHWASIGTKDTSKDLLQDSPINTDEMLDMHAFLKNFDGDFENLFKK